MVAVPAQFRPGQAGRPRGFFGAARPVAVGSLGACALCAGRSVGVFPALFPLGGLSCLLSRLPRLFRLFVPSPLLCQVPGLPRRRSSRPVRGSSASRSVPRLRSGALSVVPVLSASVSPSAAVPSRVSGSSVSVRRSPRLFRRCAVFAVVRRSRVCRRSSGSGRRSSPVFSASVSVSVVPARLPVSAGSVRVLSAVASSGVVSPVRAGRSSVPGRGRSVGFGCRRGQFLLCRRRSFLRLPRRSVSVLRSRWSGSCSVPVVVRSAGSVPARCAVRRSVVSASVRSVVPLARVPLWPVRGAFVPPPAGAGSSSCRSAAGRVFGLCSRRSVRSPARGFWPRPGERSRIMRDSRSPQIGRHTRSSFRRPGRRSPDPSASSSPRQRGSRSRSR